VEEEPIKTAELVLDMPYIVADAMLGQAMSVNWSSEEIARREHNGGSCTYHFVRGGTALLSFTLTALTNESTHIWFSTPPNKRYDQQWYDDLLASIVRTMVNIHTDFQEGRVGTRVSAREQIAIPSAPRPRPNGRKRGGRRQSWPEDAEAVEKLQVLKDGDDATEERIYKAWLRKANTNKRNLSNPRGSFRQLKMKARRR
jgi:hypothetical protein